MTGQGSLKSVGFFILIIKKHGRGQGQGLPGTFSVFIHYIFYICPTIFSFQYSLCVLYCFIVELCAALFALLSLSNILSICHIHTNHQQHWEKSHMLWWHISRPSPWCLALFSLQAHHICFSNDILKTDCPQVTRSDLCVLKTWSMSFCSDNICDKKDE